jgi:hypothetical protein
MHIKNIESQKLLKVSIARIPNGAERRLEAHAIQLFDNRDFYPYLSVKRPPKIAPIKLGAIL